MGKNMKKVLSYALGAILALGVGFSYAYAVGANDSNAFVTKTEWQAKFDQLKSSLDNISKTIYDNNMDFMMNGPRLQTSFVDGFENIASLQNTQGTPQLIYPWFEQNLTSLNNMYPRMQNLYLTDTWNGHQIVQNIYFPTGNAGAARSYVNARFALRSSDPNIYLIVTIYDGNQDGIYSVMFHYVDMTQQSTRDYSNAKIVEVTLSLNEWGMYPNGDYTPTAYSRTSEGVTTGQISDTVFWEYMDRVAADGLSNPGTGFVSRTINGTDMTFRIEFPAKACTLRQYRGSSPYSVWCLFPLDMTTRRFGGNYDRVTITSAEGGQQIAKVYSPQKGCLALKSYLNGEIPILNE